jgi:hypothetical protein
MANLTKANSDTACFFCDFPIEAGDVVYENQGKLSHVDCYQRELVDAGDSDESE